MSLSKQFRKLFISSLLNNARAFSTSGCRHSNTLLHRTVNRHRRLKEGSTDYQDIGEDQTNDRTVEVVELQLDLAAKQREQKEIETFKEKYPDFLPRTDLISRRDFVIEMLHRRDMFKRRQNLTVPEFYVGSILAVTVSDSYSPNKENRFVGICIQRQFAGLQHNFTLRNVIYGQGIEIKYDLYNPNILSIECLKMEKRLDPELFYLRDCAPEHSTFPLDMEKVPAPKGKDVPINDIKVVLNDPPWLERWERRKDLKGITGNNRTLTKRQKQRALLSEKPWRENDLMLEYRHSLRDDEVRHIKNIVDRFEEREQRRKEEAQKDNIVQS
ncbi:39S ribosomal protein L19, mitochondrial-like [Ostrea edulis]|uniref:39S ribosomal protein L19, mitochondrial-like n=1 Tax=Ostrea edulis TaxID=37623 RepID=UPI0020961846|nr:39S ribosomal protein L19, mitochondrial-like [Ostrea edulis]